MSASKLKRLGRSRRIRLAAIYMGWKAEGCDAVINRYRARQLTGLDRYADGNPFEPVALIDVALAHEEALYRASRISVG